jgi:hypothetical protein
VKCEGLLKLGIVFCLNKLGFGNMVLQWMQNGIDKFTLTHGKKMCFYVDLH